jgi:transcriptional regulator with XRE-family HTH domain
VAGDEVLRAWSEHRQAPEGGWVTMSAEDGSSMAIGQIIREVRERKALSQEELALRLRDVAANDGEHPQTTRRTISRWERDSRIPQPAYRRWLAVALDLPVETLNRAVAASQGGVPTDARDIGHTGHDDSLGELLVESDEAVLSYDAGVYDVRMRKRLVNRGSSPVCRFFMRIAVDRFPDDPGRSNEHYRRNPLTLDELEVEARCDGHPMALEVKHDRDAAKELWMLFHNERAQFPLYPGQAASLEYGYRVGDDKWGQWFQRAVRLPTAVLRVELDFPTSLSPMVWGSQTSPMMGRLPLRTAMRRNEEAGRTVFEWTTEQPTLQSRYRFEWTFRSNEA